MKRIDVTEIQIGPSYGRAAIIAASAKEEDRSFDVRFTTGARVPMAGMVNGQWMEFEESLDLGGGDIDRLQGGPLMNAHGRVTHRFGGSGLEDQVGVIESARLDGTEGVAHCRVLAHESEDRTWHGVKTRVFQNVSFGYKVKLYRDITQEGDLKPHLLGVKWEGFEISLLPVAADVDGKVRAGNTDGLTACPIEEPAATNGTGIMKTPGTPGEQAATPGAGEQTPTPAAAPVVAAATPQDPAPAVRTTVGVSAPEAGAAAATEPTALQVRTEERLRTSELLAAGRSLHLPAEFVGTIVSGEMDLGAGRGALINERARLDGEVVVSGHHGSAAVTERGSFRAAMTEALNHRVGNVLPDDAGRLPELSEQGRAYRGMSLLRMCEVVAERLPDRPAAGTYDKFDLAGRAMHTSSDFPEILADVSNLSLQRGYEDQLQTWRVLSTQINAPDFKNINVAEFGDAPNLELVPEHGSYERGTIGESKETWALATYGKMFALSRKAIINDSTGAFGRLPRMFGLASSRKESDLMWALVTGNVVMGDGSTLFHANHSNLGVSEQKLNELGLTEGRATMRLQTTLDGNTMSVIPSYLVVPPSQETRAFKETQSVNPNATSGVNPFQGAFDQVLVESRLEASSASAWYMASRPGNVEGMVYSYLDGAAGPRIETKAGWDVDGMEFKASLDFAGHFLNWRGWLKSDGTTGT